MMNEGFLFFTLFAPGFVQHGGTTTCRQCPQLPQAEVDRRTEARHTHAVSKFVGDVAFVFFYCLLAGLTENIPDKADKAAVVLGIHFRWS